MRVWTLCIVLVAVIMASAAAAAAQSSCLPLNCGVSRNEIDAYPRPNVYSVPINEGILYDRDYRPIKAAMAIYDAPDGNLIETLDEGYNFSTVLEETEGWAKIGEGRWVKSEVLGESSKPSRFAGVTLPGYDLPYTMAWTLQHLRAAETPGGAASNSNPFLYRYTRVNIYATVEVDGYNWYQIGLNQWVHQFKVAKIIAADRPAEVDTYKWVSVDLYEQVAVAYEGDRPVFATLVSSGLRDWSTNEGLFHVYLRYSRTRMSGAYNRPDFYYLEEVPWTMYFDNDIALHGTYWHDGFGFRRSHGCVNLSILDAHWLYNWAEDEFDFVNADYVGPAVYVFSSGEYD